MLSMTQSPNVTNNSSSSSVLQTGPATPSSLVNPASRAEPIDRSQSTISPAPVTESFSIYDFFLNLWSAFFIFLNTCFNSLFGSEVNERPLPPQNPTQPTGIMTPLTTGILGNQTGPSYIGEKNTLQVVQPQSNAITISNLNKKFAYNALVPSPPSFKPISFRKYGFLDNNSQIQISALPIFPVNRPTVVCFDQVFQYDASTEDKKHWSINFADPRLFSFCTSPLLAQDELQVLEHPGLYHLKAALDKADPQLKLGILNKCEIALITNVDRLGALDTKAKLSSTGQTLYGNGFMSAAQEDVASCLTKFDTPHPSNILAMAAPRISKTLFNKLYTKAHLEELFYTAYVGFRAIKEKDDAASTVLHTGHWGAGAFGNDRKTVAIIQIAAARLAGLEEVRYHNLGDAKSLQDGYDILLQIEAAQNGQPFTVDQLLTHLADNAETYGLRYQRGNGT